MNLNRIFKAFGIINLLLTSYRFWSIHDGYQFPIYLGIGSGKIFLYEIFAILLGIVLIIKREILPKGYLRLVFVLIIYFLIRFWSEGVFTQTSMRNLADSLLLILIVLIPALWKVENDSLLKAFVWNGVVFSFIHLQSYLGFHSISEQTIYGGFVRYSTSIGLICIGISFFIAFFYYFQEKKKLIFLIISIIDFIALIISFKRTTILALLIIFIYYLILLIKTGNLLIIWRFIFMIFIMMILYFSFDLFRENILRAQLSSDELVTPTSLNRMVYYTLSIEYILNNPVVLFFGDGLSGAGFYSRFIYLEIYSIHNTYLQFFLSFGIFAFSVFIYLIFKIYRNLNQVSNTNLKHGLLFSYIYILIWFIFNPTLNQVNENFICYMFLGLIITISKKHDFKAAKIN